MRQKGFSLTEMSFVITIMLILSGVIAGGGSYLMKQAHGRSAVDNGETLFQAVEANMASSAQAAFRYPVATTDTYWVMRILRPNIKAENLSADVPPVTQFRNPFTNTLEKPLSVTNTGANDYPTNPVDFRSTSYPTATSAYAGRPLYFWKNNLDPSGDIRVWAGGQERVYQWFAVQVVDERGHPIMTKGR